MSQIQNSDSRRSGLSLKNYLSLKGALYAAVAVILIFSFLSHLDSVFTLKTDLPISADPIGLENNTEYRQRIPFQKGEIEAFQIQFGTYMRLNKGILTVSLVRDSEELQSWAVDTVKLVDNRFRKFELSAPLAMDSGSSYFLVLKDRFEGGNNIAVYTSKDANRIEYKGNVLNGRSFSAVYEVSDPARKSACKKAALILTILGAMATSLFVNPKNVRTWSYILLLVSGLLAFRVLDYSLFQNLTRTEYIADGRHSQKEDTIAPNSLKRYLVDTGFRDFDTLRIYLEGDIRENIHVMLAKDDGSTYFDSDISADDIAGDGRTGKTAINLYRKDQFTPGVYTAEIANTGDAPLKISVQENGTLNFGILSHTFLAGKIALFVIAVLFIYAAVMFALLASRSNVGPGEWFLITSVPFAVIYLVLFTPWSHPDTHRHMYAEYRLSNVLLGYPEEDQWKGRREDVEFLQHAWFAQNKNERNPSLESYSSMAGFAHFLCEKPEIVPLPGTDDKMKFYSVLNYLPQVAGFTLGRLLNLSTFVSLYLGRIFILALYIVMMYRNIRNIPSGRWIFATVALLPMALMISSSVSYDAMVIISSFSFIACILRLKADNSRWAYFEAALWAFIAGAVKGGGYALILMPLAFILFEQDDKNGSLLKIAGLAAAAFFSVLLFDKIIPASSGFQFGSENSYKLTAAFALHEPLRYLDMAMSSYLTYLDFLTLNASGASLALLEWTIPATAVVLFMAAGGILAVFEKDDIELRPADKWIFATVILAGLTATPAMLLSWTDTGSVRVEGLQGRYFIPLVPLFCYILTKFSLHAPMKDNMEPVVRKGVLWMSVLSGVFVFYIMTLYLTR